MTGRRVFMLGPAPQMRGGIAAVAASLIEGGLDRQVGLRYLNTFAERGAAAKAVNFARALLQLHWALLRGQVLLVHAHVASGGSFWRKSLLLAVARAFRVPTIFHLHGGGFAEFTQRLGPGSRQRWVRLTLERSTRVVVLSPSWQVWVQGFAPAARTVLMPNPVRVPALPPERVGAGRRVLYLGLVSEGKGSYDLLRAWQVFQGSHADWRLQIGGNGEIDNWLGEALRMGVRDSIDYLGWLDAEAKAAALAAADIFVLPSYREGMPVALLEAMAHGLPVVSTPVGGTPDILDDGVEGLMVSAGDVPALARALERLADDAALRERMGAAGRARVLAHNELAAVVQRWLALYADLTRDQPGD